MISCFIETSKLDQILSLKEYPILGDWRMEMQFFGCVWFILGPGCKLQALSQKGGKYVPFPQYWRSLDLRGAA